MQSSAEIQTPADRTRRQFLVSALKAGALVAVVGFDVTNAVGACSYAYGSGVYGQACYAGELPKVLSAPQNQTNISQAGFRFFLQGEPNRSYEIQYSSDLATWAQLGILTVPADGAPTEILDSATAQTSRRFYRANPL